MQQVRNNNNNFVHLILAIVGNFKQMFTIYLQNNLSNKFEERNPPKNDLSFLFNNVDTGYLIKKNYNFTHLQLTLATIY